jgi:hypothetical protein
MGPMMPILSDYKTRSEIEIGFGIEKENGLVKL